MNKTVVHADSLEYLKTLPENSVDAIVTDPPYELGFMGKGWDKTGIANSVELWSLCLKVLKPGGHLLSFGGTRTYHRMASAIEDAGFEVRDMVEWVYGSGFPKSLNIGKAVDKLQGNVREVVGEQKLMGTARRMKGGNFNDFGGEDTADVVNLTKGTSEWEGWGTALKPAHEPIVLARKPIEKGLSVAENCLKWGTGGLDIDGSRVEGIPPSVPQPQLGVKKAEIYNFATGEGRNGEMSNSTLGRFPANLLHDNSEEVTECFPDCKMANDVSEFKQLESMRFSAGGMGIKKQKQTNGKIVTGNASRFFKSILYYPKASKKERNEGMEESRNTHPTVKPVALMEYLIQMVSRPGQTILDPFAGSGTTLVAAKRTGRGFIGIEKEAQYIPIIHSRIEAAPEPLF